MEKSIVLLAGLLLSFSAVAQTKVVKPMRSRQMITEWLIRCRRLNWLSMQK